MYVQVYTLMNVQNLQFSTTAYGIAVTIFLFHSLVCGLTNKYVLKLHGNVIISTSNINDSSSFYNIIVVTLNFQT